MERVTYISKQASPNRDDAKLKEVEALIDTIPVYPGSSHVHTSRASKDLIAGITRTYRVDASYDQLKEFYVDTLIPVGWSLESERALKDWWWDPAVPSIPLSR